MIYDAIVVGGGPAGAVLAYELARRGLEVLLLEKATLPRYKPCGGGLTLKTLRALPFDAAAALDRPAEGGIVSYAGRPLLQVEVERPLGWLAMRDRFDHFLVQQAVAAGAHLVEGARVVAVEADNGRMVARTENEAFAGRLLAGADGVNSVVARSLGLLTRRQTGVAVEAEVAVPPAAQEAQGNYLTFDFGALRNGYGWIFPKRDHLSVGVGVLRTSGGKAAGLKESLARFLDSQPVLRQAQVLQVRGHRIPLGGGRDALHKGRALLVGDAANLADPWLGEGVCYAVTSARIAADVMATALADGSLDLSAYTAQVHARIVDTFRAARFLAALVYRFPRFASLLLSRSQRLQRLLFANLVGELSFPQLVRCLPRLLLKEQ